MTKEEISENEDFASKLESLVSQVREGTVRLAAFHSISDADGSAIGSIFCRGSIADAKVLCFNLSRMVHDLTQNIYEVNDEEGV